MNANFACHQHGTSDTHFCVRHLSYPAALSLLHQEKGVHLEWQLKIMVIWNKPPICQRGVSGLQSKRRFAEGTGGRAGCHSQLTERVTWLAGPRGLGSPSLSQSPARGRLRWPRDAGQATRTLTPTSHSEKSYGSAQGNLPWEQGTASPQGSGIAFTMLPSHTLFIANCND